MLCIDRLQLNISSLLIVLAHNRVQALTNMLHLSPIRAGGRVHTSPLRLLPYLVKPTALLERIMGPDVVTTKIPIDLLRHEPTR